MLPSYIFDDRCKWEDAYKRLGQVYSLSPEERKSRGLKGREWALSEEAGFTSKHQAKRVIEAFNELFEMQARCWQDQQRLSKTKKNGMFE